MENIIIVLVLLVIVGAAAWHVYRSKKRGVKCIGCPEGCSCSSKGGCSGCSGCGGNPEEN